MTQDQASGGSVTEEHVRTYHAHEPPLYAQLPANWPEQLYRALTDALPSLHDVRKQYVTDVLSHVVDRWVAAYPQEPR